MQPLTCHNHLDQEAGMWLYSTLSSSGSHPSRSLCFSLGSQDLRPSLPEQERHFVKVKLTFLQNRNTTEWHDSFTVKQTVFEFLLLHPHVPCEEPAPGKETKGNSQWPVVAFGLGTDTAGVPFAVPGKLFSAYLPMKIKSSSKVKRFMALVWFPSSNRSNPSAFAFCTTTNSKRLSQGWNKNETIRMRHSIANSHSTPCTLYKATVVSRYELQNYIYCKQFSFYLCWAIKIPHKLDSVILA